MSKARTTRSCAFGLRIVSPGSEEWHWFANCAAMASELALRLYSSTHRLGHGSSIGPRVPFTTVDADGLCITWIRETPYQAEHTHYGATWRIRTEWKTYEAFGSNGCQLQIEKVLNSFDLEGLLSRRKKGGIRHGDRGHGPVPRIRKSRGGSGLFRDIQTSQEVRLNALVLLDEGEIPARAARSKRNLPTSWDDFLRDTQRSWKGQRKGRKRWAR